MEKEEARDHISSEIKRLCSLAHKNNINFIAACDHDEERMHTECNAHTLFTANLTTELIMKTPEIIPIIPQAIEIRKRQQQQDPENDFRASSKNMDL